VFRKEEGAIAPTILLLHGGGHTAETWTLLSQELSRHCNIIAPDLRGHGLSKTTDNSDLSMPTLVNDIVQILGELCAPWVAVPSSRTATGTATHGPQLWPDAPPPLFIVGHSLGGALAVNLEQSGRLQPSHLLGIVVLDVVEGTALAALDHMQDLLKRRPQYFPTMDDAVQWHLRRGILRNIDSALLR
jgi:protein phosphatase methylesterase 1